MEDRAEQYYQEGTDFFHQCRYTEALASFDKAIAINPNMVKIWLTRGYVLFDLGRDTEARDSIDKAKRIVQYSNKVSDWIALELADLDSTYWQKINSSIYEWRVFKKNGEIHTELVDSDRNSKITFNVDDGMIISENAGEFGGRVYWESTDHKNSYSISPDQINSFIETPIGLLGLGGLAHLSIRFGYIAKYYKENGKWHSIRIKNFKDCLDSCVGYNNGLWIIAGSRLLYYSYDDVLIELINDGFWHRVSGPNSMVIDENETIFLGMRHGIIAIKKGQKDYEIKWLIPNPDFSHLES